jgi:hypothetical protein
MLCAYGTVLKPGSSGLAVPKLYDVAFGYSEELQFIKGILIAIIPEPLNDPHWVNPPHV